MNTVDTERVEALISSIFERIENLEDAQDRMLRVLAAINKQLNKMSKEKEKEIEK